MPNQERPTTVEAPSAVITMRVRVTDMCDGTYRPELVIEGGDTLGLVSFGLPRKCVEEARRVAMDRARAAVEFFGSEAILAI
jgi:hypothetical protein